MCNNLKRKGRQASEETKRMREISEEDLIPILPGRHNITIFSMQLTIPMMGIGGPPSRESSEKIYA